MAINNLIRYRSDIDGLRAVAILLVVLYHSGVTFLSGGFIGVDVFFVISGFLIGGIINKEILAGKFTYANFYARRIKRIAPALVVMLIICSLFSYFFLSPEELSDFAKYTAATLLSIPNIALWQGTDYFSANSELNPLLMTWSLGVEEQFYIFLPIIFIFCFSKCINLFYATLVITICSFLLCAIVTFIKPLPSFYLLPTRAWEMGVGVLLALKYKDLSESNVVKKYRVLTFFIGGGLILIPAIFFNHDTVFPGYMAALPVIGSALIILSESRVSNIFLGNRVMASIGLISYSWYLWHWPLLSFSRIAYNGALPVINALTVSFIALIISCFSYKFVEIPFRKKNSFGNKIVIQRYCVVVILFLIPLSLIIYNEGLRYRVDKSVIDSEEKRSLSIGNRCLVGDTNKLPEFPECMPRNNKPAMVLLGDSHASALRSGVDNFAQRSGLSVYQFTKSSCPNLLGVPRYLKKAPEHAKLCNEFNQSAIDEVIKNKNIKIVLISAFWDAGIDSQKDAYGYHIYRDRYSSNNIEALRVGLSSTIKALKDNGKIIILVKDVPFFKFDVVKEVTKNNMPLRFYISKVLGAEPNQGSYSKEVIGNIKSVGELIDNAGGPGVKILSPSDSLCNVNGCQYTEKGVAIYYDQQHLNDIGGVIALDKL